MKLKLLFCLLLFVGVLGFGQSIFENPILGTNPNTANPYTTGQVVDPNITVSGIGRGAGINGTNANNRYNANGWNTATIDLTAYFEFTITPNAGFEIDFVSFVYTSQRSNASISNFAFRSSIDGFNSNLGTPLFDGATIDLSSFQNINGPITFRFYAWGTSAASTTTFSINDFTFNGTVTSACVPVHSITNFEPVDGPVDTEVRINGSGFSASTAVAFNGIPASVSFVDANTLLAEVPAGATTGAITVTENSCNLITSDFTVITNITSSCEGSAAATPTDLFISAVTDATINSFTYIELFNGTTSPINLSGYSIQFFNNGSATQNGGNVNLNTIVLNVGDVYVIGVGATTICSGIAGSDGSFANQTSGIGGINFGTGNDDHIRLYNGATHVDSWGFYQNNDWSSPLGIGTRGAIFERLETAASLPNTNFNLADWSVVNWNDCSDTDYSSIGSFSFSSGGGMSPSVSVPLYTASNCLEATISVTATEGFVGGNALNYQWYAVAPGDTNWTALTNDAVYSGVDTNELNISNTFSLNNYQYYCEVRENTATCSQASDAVRIEIEQTTWNGTAWSNGAPNAGTVAILNANYTTAAPTPSFTACNLVVNAILDIRDGYFVEVINDASVNTDGNIIVQTRGAFVQRNDAGTFVLNGGNSSVNKDTAPKQNWYDYTYWSSPVVNETAENAFGLSPANRRFYFEAQNFVDIDGNDIDDIGNDWQIATGLLTPGLGYAVTSFNVGLFPRIDQNNFNGAFNNGIINVPVYRNPANPIASNNWNFIGNPYPSAIDFEEFHNQNAGAIEGSAYLWSQSLPPLAMNPGNQVLNFNRNDYAIINVGSGNVAGGAVGLPPNNFIPSGQGFFVNATGNGTVTFNNSIRLADGSSNNNFYRSNNVVVLDKLWLNLTSDNGVFNQILVAYVPGATNNDDGMYYDAPRNLSTGTYASLYSIIKDSDKPFAIQGKNPMSLNADEVIALGFSTSIEVATLYRISIAQLQGDFMTSETVYLKDNLLNGLHNLSESDYTFTSEVGDFKERFEVVFNRESLSVGGALLSPQSLSIIELSNGDVQFSVAENHQIKTIEIIDLQGRTIYRLKGASNLETYNLSQLSSATYVAKVTLSNGQTINKKAIKR